MPCHERQNGVLEIIVAANFYLKTSVIARDFARHLTYSKRAVVNSLYENGLENEKPLSLLDVRQMIKFLYHGELFRRSN